MVQDPETRQSLLVRLNDPTQSEAWSEFVEIYEPLIYRVARGRGLQHADAQDMTQEVLSIVGRSISSFDPDAGSGSFRGWLSRITRNLVINFLTRGKETPGSGDSAVQHLLHQTPSGDDETQTLFLIQRQREVFRWAADRIRSQFSESTWQAFWLSGVESEPIEAVARRLGKSPGAVRIARCRVLAKLREEVKKFDDDTCPGTDS